MDYYLLVDLAICLGYELAMSGAETFRVEDTICRVLSTYDIEAEVFAIPNCLTVSITGANRKPMTRMHRIGYHGNDLEAVEKFNALSRRICAERPDPETAMKWFYETKQNCRIFSFPMQQLGNFLGSFGFGLFFGGNIIDGICAGLCGLVVGVVLRITDSLKANQFFTTITASLIGALVAYTMAFAGLSHNVDAVIIGTVMILVPGMLFTNSMRDIIYGDTNSGINRMVQVILIALAIALGAAAAWSATASIWGQPAQEAMIVHPFLLHCLVAMIGCIGFSILFNVHGWGMWLCALGGFMTWAVYLTAVNLGSGIIWANFWAAAFASAYAECMARIRKYPAISYLVVSAFPLFPGSGIYYTTSYALQGNLNQTISKGLETASIAGVMAVGILLVSTIFRLYYVWKNQKHPGACKR